MVFNATYYPIMNTNNTGDLLEVFQFIGGPATGGLFFPLIILVIWVVQFIGVLSDGKQGSRAWVYASFTSTILAIMLGILALVEQRWIYLLVIMVSLGAFWLKLASKKD